ncbi:unnamed protein product, partial [Ectocarpus sp. 8 AP-2014]
YCCLFSKRDTLSCFVSSLMVKLQVLWPCGADDLGSSPGEVPSTMRIQNIIILQISPRLVFRYPIRFSVSVSLVPAQIAPLGRQKIGSRGDAASKPSSAVQLAQTILRCPLVPFSPQHVFV